MIVLLQYMLKLSICLMVVFLFYQFVLRRLTFYNWNRWYLVAYSLLSFFIPFIDISLVLDRNEWESASIIKWVPAFEAYSGGTVVPQEAGGPSMGFILGLILLTGMAVMLIRLLIQLFSFRKMIKKAEWIPAEGMNIYQINESIIPFSFGNSIFINQSLHTDEELREIILHEFVHVKQKHSVDIIWSEFLCLVNWYNPFAWLIRRSIRQNLEFIADHQVLENGLDRKQYQYLLLKVIGNNQFSIASKFNFSSLKKRIAMMNKMKSAGVHLVKFLFILPLVAVLLVAFRNNYQDQQQNSSNYSSKPIREFVYTDTVPAVKVANIKGYYINVKGLNGECMVVVKDKEGKLIEQVPLNEWTDNAEKFEEKYGDIPPPPPARAPIPPTEWIPTTSQMGLTAPIPPNAPTEAIAPIIPTRCCEACPTPVAIICPTLATGHGCHIIGLRKLAKEYEITDKLASITLKNGSKETYDLTKPEEKARFEKNYGKIVNTMHDIGVSPSLVAAGGLNGQTVIAPFAPGSGQGVTIIDDYGHTITGKEDILVTITSNTSRQQLDEFKVKMKEKGIDLTFDDIEYNEKGKLVSISGRMKSPEGQSNFVARDFEKLCLAMIKKGEQTYFKVSTKDREVI